MDGDVAFWLSERTALLVKLVVPQFDCEGCEMSEGHWHVVARETLDQGTDLNLLGASKVLGRKGVHHWLASPCVTHDFSQGPEGFVILLVEYAACLQSVPMVVAELAEIQNLVPALTDFKLGTLVLRHTPEHLGNLVGVLGDDFINLSLTLGDHSALHDVGKLALSSVLEPCGGSLWVHQRHVDVRMTHGPLDNLLYDVVKDWN